MGAAEERRTNDPDHSFRELDDLVLQLKGLVPCAGSTNDAARTPARLPCRGDRPRA
jgi:hypothetical protein